MIKPFQIKSLYVIRYLAFKYAVYLSAIITFSVAPLTSSAKDQHAIPAQYYWSYLNGRLFIRGELKSSDSQAIQDGIPHVTSQVPIFSGPGGEWIVGPIRENPSKPTLSFINFEERLASPNNNVIIPSITLQVRLHCPGDATQIFINNKYYCGCPTSSEIPINGQCVKPRSCSSQTQNTIGNPCNVATGQKIHQESLPLGRGFNVNLAYRSGENGSTSLANGWTNGSNVSLSTSLIKHNKIGVIRGGTVELLLSSGRGKAFRAHEDSRISYLEESTEGYTIYMKGGDREYFDKAGKLIRRENGSGTGRVSTFDAEGRILQQRDQYGYVVNYEYTPSGRLISVNNSRNIEYRFEYDLAGNLEFIVFPDETPATWADNPKKQFHYENAEYISHLTGITDENGARYANYAYDTEGRVVLSEHAQTTNNVGQERVELSY